MPTPSEDSVNMEKGKCNKDKRQIAPQKQGFQPVYLRIIIYIYMAVSVFNILTCTDFSKGRMFELCESYPRIIAQKITIMNVSFGSFGIALASLVSMDLKS